MRTLCSVTNREHLYNTAFGLANSYHPRIYPIKYSIMAEINLPINLSRPRAIKMAGASLTSEFEICNRNVTFTKVVELFRRVISMTDK